MAENKTLVIIDGNSLINRAYYAIQRPMITKDGMYTQGIYGFLTMLQKIFAEYDPAYITVCFDRKAPTFRHDEYKEYKAGRKQMPMELAMELEPMKEILGAMNISILEIDGFEADDIIGTVAKRGEEAGLEPLIITGDKDALQLATEKTKIVIMKKGISTFEMWDEAAMNEHYGFGPKQFIDLKGLMGDSSDNIPGIPGVGEKTGIKLIDEFGSVENLIERSSEISSEKLRQKIDDNAQLAIMSKRLATIVTDVPIETDINSMKREEPDLEKLVPIYVKLEFNSFLRKLKAGSGTAGIDSPKRKVSFSTDNDDDPWDKNNSDNTVKKKRTAEEADTAPGAPKSSYETVTDKQEIPNTDQIQTEFQTGFSEMIKEPGISEILTGDSGSIKEKIISAAGADKILAFKLLGIGSHQEKSVAFGLCLGTEDHYYYINLEQDESILRGIIDMLCEMDIRLIGHEIKTDFYMLYSLLGKETRVPEVLFDTAVAQYLLDPSASNYSLHRLCLEFFGIEVRDTSDFFKEAAQIDMLSDNSVNYSEYGSIFCRAVLSLREIQSQRIQSEDLAKILNEVELPLIEVLAEMEAEGFPFDENALKEIGEKIDNGIVKLQGQIYEICGEEFNINSPKQLGFVLFENMKLPFAKKTKSGYATGAEILEKLVPDYPVAGKILEYRTLTKLKGTYIDGLIPLKAADGRIHAHFNQTVAATGRLSCTDPNLQNIPIRQDFGRQIRKAFVPGGDEYILVGADYSQIELRILAHYSKDPALLEDFRSGADIHRRTAARVFEVAEDKVSIEQRSSAKAVNFGIIYGMSSFGLSEGLGITRREAERYIEEYFARHPAVKSCLDGFITSVKEKGYSETLLGRKRVIPEISAHNYMVRQSGERLAMNTPIQGSAADIMKLAMIGVYNTLRKSSIDAGVILQVHDELIIRAHKEAAAEAAAILKREMESALTLDVPLTVDVNTASSWYELK